MLGLWIVGLRELELSGSLLPLDTVYVRNWDEYVRANKPIRPERVVDVEDLKPARLHRRAELIDHTRAAPVLLGDFPCWADGCADQARA
jgi:hypothetical protein